MFALPTLAAAWLQWKGQCCGNTVAQYPKHRQSSTGHPATQGPHLPTGQMTRWSWGTMTIRFGCEWHTGHAEAPPRCWHTEGRLNNAARGHRCTFRHLLTSKGTAKDTFYTPSKQTPCLSSICKPDCWSHSPVSSQPPKICVTSSGKGPDTSKEGHCSCNVIQS